MFGDKYRNLLSSVARAAEVEGGVAEAPPAGDTPPAVAPAGDQTPPAEGAGKLNGATEPPADPPQPKRRSTETVFQDRIGELTRHRREAERKATEAEERAGKAERELRAAQELLAARGEHEGEAAPAKPAAPASAPAASAEDFLKSPEGKRAVEQQSRAEARAAEITRRGDEVYDTAVKEFGQAKVDKALGNFRAFDGLRVELAEALFDLPDAHKVLYEIGNNPDQIDKLYKLADTNPIKMAVEVARIASSVTAKPTPKKISDAPEPPDIVNGRGNAGPPDLNDRDLPMSKWVEEREKDLKKRGVRL